MGNSLNKLGIEFKSGSLNRDLPPSSSVTSSPKKTPTPNTKKSLDGNYDDNEDEDDFFKLDENDEKPVDDILDSLGLSQQDCPTVGKLKKALIVSDSSSTQSKVISSQPLVYIDGQENNRKLINFLI